MTDFSTVCRSSGGTKTLSKDAFEFHDANSVEQTAKQLGFSTHVPDLLRGRIYLVEQRGSRLLIHAQKRKGDACEWLSTVKAGWWTQVHDHDVGDDDIRHIIRCDESGHGDTGKWYVMLNNGRWSRKFPSAVKTVYQAKGFSKPDAERRMGELERDPWIEVCIPFAPEHPAERQWNIGAPQYRCEPVEGPHPTWNMIHDHIGRALDRYYKGGGRLYLQQWLAAAIQDPTCRLPYLFMHGVENSGKSIVWESLSLLITGGIIKADRALTSQSDFNGELDGAVFAIVEEKEIGRFPGVSEKIKDAVTSPTLSIRRMRTDTYQIPNYSHWIQTSNIRSACLVPLGDTRFTVMEVQRPPKDIPKPVLMEQLKSEAPAFLWTLLNMKLPELEGRLAIPALDTDDKRAVQAESLPEFVHRLIGYIEEHRTWIGTAKEFRSQFGGTCLNLPRLKDALSKFAPVLAHNSITFSYPSTRLEGGMPVRFEWKS
ncbi:primase-helicase family protein [Lacipirellula parvula]|uniref:NrS-1 polymerase-like helicase domain-containing protein n=1 Tax=Lacipirellula parvula TaxID=2650471 RepID=A0A5K7XEX6_9BACT|nr:DUF5906 domain-containing protein [Lacipirellula parvula]BBO31549.1 hypothetical protein PLANPX_1161 [Lacipirellula parvula]